MNRQDIIRMAQEAGWMHEHDSETGFVAEAATKFAALVAAAERDRIARECSRLPFGDTAASFAAWIAQGGGQTL